MTEPTTLTQYRHAALAAVGIAAAYGIYLLYTTQSSASARTTLHRSNAVYRARGERARPRVELGGPDSEAPLGRLTIRRGNNVLVTNLAQLRFPSIDQITTAYGSQFATEVHTESISVGLNAILLSCLRARRPESRQMLAQMGLMGLPEALLARDEELCKAILLDAMPRVPQNLIDQALQRVWYADATMGDDHSLPATPTIAETEITSTPQDPSRDQGIKGLLYYIAEEDSKREAYEHRGITCEECSEFPIRGVRWHCLNCPDYDLCSTCEAHSLHDRTHVFIKIKIPLPILSQPCDARPIYYPGNHASATQESLDGSTKKRLAQQYGFAEHKLDALYDQFMCLANVEWPEDPAKINVAMDAQAFGKAMTPPGWDTHTALSTICDCMFDFYDTNADDLIGFLEFVDGMAYLRSSQRFAPLRRALKCFDVDDDGYVDRLDIVRILEAKSTLERQMTRDAVARYEPEKTEAGLNSLGPSQPTSSIFHEEEIPQGETRAANGKRYDAHGDKEPLPGARAVLEDTDPWPREENPRRRIRFANAMPSHERLRNFSSRFEEILHSPPGDEPDVGANAEALWEDQASALASAGDRIDHEHATPSLSVLSDAGFMSDLLARHVGVGLDELLDPIFGVKERQFVEAKATRDHRRRWRATIDEYVKEKRAFQEELHLMAQVDPLLATAVNPNGRLDKKRRPSLRSAQAPEPAFRGEIVPTDAETLTRREREIAEKPLEELLSATGYSRIDTNDNRPPATSQSNSIAGSGQVDDRCDSHSDPTLPQNRPNKAVPYMNDLEPSKQRLEDFLQHDEVEREAEQRGGPARLTLDELEAILIADSTQALRGLLLGWLEMASF